jgi:hypothetical protein
LFVIDFRFDERNDTTIAGAATPILNAVDLF